MAQDEIVQGNAGDILPDFVTEDILKDFLAEAGEGIQGLEFDFIALEKNPDDAELINKIFRVIHSVKGASSFIGFRNLESISHKTEDVLNKLRKSELTLTPCIMDILLSAVDSIKLILKDIEENRSDTHISTGPVIEKLVNIVTECRQAKEFELEQSTHPGAVQPSEPEKTPRFTAPKVAIQAPAREDIRSVRINVERLDYLFNLVGELVLSRNRHIQLQRHLWQKYPNDETISLDLLEAGSYLNRLTSDIQLAVMKTRMIPISSIFNKFQRIVRDLAKSLKKEVEIYISGEYTEIDKNIIEGIGDPLTHIVRNSVDHGLEMPDEREAAGKPRAGYIELKSYYEGNYVIISVKDDGKGIDLEAVRKKAVEKGMITASDAEKLSKNTLLGFIFAPGFSTAKNITATSGRGVGMDVVRTNIEKLRGQIILDSDLGAGTELKLKIPLTLAILETLVVTVSGQKYAIPLPNVTETHRTGYGQIEMVRGKRVFRMRDELMPLVLLSEVFNLPHKYDDAAEVTIVVLKHGMLKMGLVVDKTSGQEEVVIKPLDCLDGISEPKGLSGATILGDGSITFILDVDELMKLTKAGERQLDAENPGVREAGRVETDTINVVLVDNLDKEQYAVPARRIKEIEIIKKTDIEEIGGRMMIKYRGKIISLTTIPCITGVPDHGAFENYYMVILTGQEALESRADTDGEVGLLVGRLLGIKKTTESSFDRNRKALSGVRGSTIFNGRTTFLLDIEEVVASTALS
ncbi:MAG: chemotaxis protein CheA [Nitrospirae bacterium]|nr:chemotaxis protein CheA [Nitrospirota bacterium]